MWNYRNIEEKCKHRSYKILQKQKRERRKSLLPRKICRGSSSSPWKLILSSLSSSVCLCVFLFSSVCISFYLSCSLQRSNPAVVFLNCPGHLKLRFFSFVKLSNLFSSQQWPKHYRRKWLKCLPPFGKNLA